MREQIEVMAVPFQQQAALIIPNNLVEYVLPYAMPLPSSYSHSALVGSLIYQNEKIPVIDASVLFGQEGETHLDSGTRRIIIVSCIIEHEEFSTYAVIANESPKIFNISVHNMQEVARDLPSPFYSKIETDKDLDYELYILDLQALEERIFD